MKLKVLSSENMETVREWRAEVPETLRTPYDLTYEMQQDYYKNVISNRESRTRYWGIWEQLRSGVVAPSDGNQDDYLDFIGYGGIENIEWENSRGEISLLIGPDYRREGYGAQAVELILDKAFNYMRLANVHGECYKCSPAVPFWERLVDKYGGFGVTFPGTKFYDGVTHSSYLFNFENYVFEARSIHE